MTPWCLQAIGWPKATARWKLCRATALLLAFALAALDCPGVEGRSVRASRSGAYSVQRRLRSIALPAGGANEGWTLGRASYNSPPDTFSKSFKQKCYELRCINSIVPGNYSSDNTPIPYATAKDQLEPVYELETYGNTPPVDDYNRVFSGNVLNATRQLFTQCWNQTDAKGLLSPSGSIFVQVTDTCTCTGGSVDACCTNIPHFNLRYQAFEKLAHPDYGLLNLMFRPVDCSTKAALPLEPGFVNKTIYKDQVGTGWGVGGTAVRRLQQDRGLFKSNATCFAMPQDGDDIFFFCRECDRPGYQPFLLSNTSGLQFYIKDRRPDVSATGDDISSGTRRVRALFQNRFRRCIPVLDQVTSFRLQKNHEATSFVLACLDDTTLLPSTLHPAGSAVPMPDYPNCFIPFPAPIDQEGKFVTGVQPQPSQDVSGYTAFPFSDLPYQYDMNPVLGSCFASSSSSSIAPSVVQQVNTCMARDAICCYDAAGDQESDVPDKLDQICNNLATNGSICQGFVYNTHTKTGFFKGAPETPGLTPPTSA
ncbi:hypothetical protein ABBQ32_008218 [Trebouxia sp. C0010 RCD-2024]